MLHDLAAAARYADTLIAMKDGRIITHGPPHDTVDEALVKDLYALDADILRAPGRRLTGRRSPYPVPELTRCQSACGVPEGCRVIRR